MKDFEVYETDNKPVQVTMGEIQALDHLVTRRRHWLSDPRNQQRATYKAIQADTDRLARQLARLRDELNDKINNQQPKKQYNDRH